MPEKIALISLGCSKNLVESEQILASLEDAGFEIAAEPDGADACIVNTCGFIESAKAEAVDVILEMAALKNKGKLRAIIAAGCLAERYKEEMLRELPEIDAIVGVGSAGIISEAVRAALDGEEYANFPDINAPVEERERALTTGPAFAFVKIAEGCNNKCAYCVIPSIRGNYRSRKIEDIVAECEELARGGIKELIIIAQDTTMYGADLYSRPSLAALLERLEALEGIEWIRVHYLYPDNLDDGLISLFAASKKLLHYFDIPLQHVSDRLLKAMRRRYSGAKAWELIQKIRHAMPDAVIRTSIIVGLPGETEADFEELCLFLKETRLERVGVFAYSAEERTPAFEMENQIDETIKQQRLETLYTLQEPIMEDWCDARAGGTLHVMVEEYDADTELYSGRSYADSPEIDGRVYFSSQAALAPGHFADVLIEARNETDLTGHTL